jgi:hypothetical protein
MTENSSTVNHEPAVIGDANANASTHRKPPTFEPEANGGSRGRR